MVAVILNIAFNENIYKISRNQRLLIFVLSILIALSKLVYVPILFLLVLIPSRKFSSAKIKIGILAIVIGAGFGTALVQKSVIDSKYIPYSEYDEVYRDQSMLKKGVDINKQIDFVMANPITTSKFFFKSFFKEFRHMTRGYIGILGWADINLPSWFIILAYLIIFFITIFNFENINISGFTLIQRSFIGLTVIGLLVLIMLSQYLSWDLVGEDRVYPLQGRYFIPVFPLFFIMLFNVIKTKLKPSFTIAAVKGVFLFCLFSGILSVYSVVSKSYILQNYSQAKWKVNYSFKDKLSDTTSNRLEYIINKQDTVATFEKPRLNFITDEKKFAGPLSLKLANNNPYGFILKIYKGLANEKFIVSYRGLGYGGLLVVQEFPKGYYYQSGKTYDHRDSLGWKFHEVQFILPNNISDSNELRVYVWNPDEEVIYIDDFSLTYFEKD